MQLDAIAYAGPAVPVSLASVFNINGITTSGVPFNSGGFDGSSWAWSAELLGSYVPWHGISFPLGPANVPNAVYGTTIPLPSGVFGSLLLLGDLVNNQQPPTAQFVIHYTDGTSTTIQQDMSDWVNPRNYSGESLIKCVPTRYNFDGTTDPNSSCAYGYQLPLDSTRTALSLTLPLDRNVVVLSLVALPPIVPGSFVYTPAAGTILFPGQQTLTGQFQPTSPGFGPVTTAVNLVVTPASPRIVPTITWPTPVPIRPNTAISGTQLNASASSLFGPVLLSLAPYARVNAFYDDGSVYKETGFDGTLRAFSANQLGSSLQYLGFSFPLGEADVPDAVTSSKIPLPAGNFATLYLLGAAGIRAQLAQPLTVTYSDGTSSSTLLNLSSWTNPQHFSGETTVASTTVADLSTGLHASGSYNVYGYQVPLDPTRTVASMILPANLNVVFLAAGLGIQGTFPVAGTFVYTPPAGTVPPDSTLLNTIFTPFDTTNFTVASASRQLIVGVRDFTLQTAGPSVMTAKMGESPSLAFLVAPAYDHYAHAISFSLIGALPPLATASFSPSSVGMYDGETRVTLTITTRKLSSNVMPILTGHSASVIVCFLIVAPYALQKKRFSQIACTLFVFAIGFGMVGCGTGYADHVYPLTIQATDGVTTHSLPVELHIQASPQ